MSILYPNQYIHILNNDTGIVRIEIGPKRVVLSGNEEQVGSVKTGRIVSENQYCVIKNPFDEEKGEYLMGQREIIVGPAVVFLQFNSSIEEVTNIHVLSQGQALRLQAIQTHDSNGTEIPAGKIWQIKGPCRFIPNRYTKVVQTIDTILVNQGEGIYVRNIDTSEKKLVEGPCGYLLEVNEEFWKKSYTDMEVKALQLNQTQSFRAKPVHLKKGQVVCILDEEKNEHYRIGPGSYLLQPEERVKILMLAAGKPKQPYQIKAAVINMGPDFMSDRFEVRTKDNAHLSLLITYKWQFLTEGKDVSKIFSMPDFIGYSCTTLTSLIREEVSKYSFEEFHSNSVGLVMKKLFSKHMVGGKEVFGYYFPEISFLVNEVDVKEVTPVNREIQKLLNQSIKNNMKIVCQKVEQEASLLAEKERIKANQKLAAFQSELIDIENNNLELEKVEKARIQGEVKIKKAEFKKEAEKIEILATQSTDLQRMKKLIELLNTPEGEKYMKLIKTENMSQINQKWYVSSENNLDLNL